MPDPRIVKADQQWLAFWMDKKWMPYDDLMNDSERLAFVIEKLKGYRRAVGTIEGG